MSFYLIYIDEYGNSGTRLDDPRQPLFALQAAFVPVDGGAWSRIERENVELLDEIHKTVRDKSARLHMVDMYQRKGVYRGVGVHKVFGWIERVLATAAANGTSYLTLNFDKNAFIQTGLREPHRGLLDEIGGQLHMRVAPYEILFPNLLLEIDTHLENIDAYGMLIVDQHKGQKFERFGLIDAYGILRAENLLTRVVENPIFRDSRVHTLLAVPDFSGYVTSSLAVDKLIGKSRPQLTEWYERYVQPCSLSSPIIPKNIAEDVQYQRGQAYAFSSVAISLSYIVHGGNNAGNEFSLRAFVTEISKLTSKGKNVRGSTDDSQSKPEG